jgi:hypothetical protein
MQLLLGGAAAWQGGRMPAFLDHHTYGFADADLDRHFFMGAAAVGAGKLLRCAVAAGFAALSPP